MRVDPFLPASQQGNEAGETTSFAVPLIALCCLPLAGPGRSCVFPESDEPTKNWAPGGPTTTTSAVNGNRYKIAKEKCKHMSLEMKQVNARRNMRTYSYSYYPHRKSVGQSCQAQVAVLVLL